MGAPFVYVASAADGRIYVFALDAGTGGMSATGFVDAGNGTSYLAMDPAHRLLVAANSGGNEVAAFTVNPATGALGLLNARDSAGANPAFVGTDRSGKFVLVANYSGGSAGVLPLTSAGVGAPSSVVSSGAMAHFIETDLSNRFAFVPCLGADQVAQYLFDADAGVLTPNAVPALKTAPGAGPRHLAFHPDGKRVYLINEVDSTVSALILDATTGQLTAFQTLSTLPPGFTGRNTAAEVQVHPNGRFLYASNRGNDSIVAFALDGAGAMTVAGFTPTGGATPRHFSLDPAGQLLFVANQGSDSVVVFRVDPATGALNSTGQTISVRAPEFVGVFRLPSAEP